MVEGPASSSYSSAFGEGAACVCVSLPSPIFFQSFSILDTAFFQQLRLQLAERFTCP